MAPINIAWCQTNFKIISNILLLIAVTSKYLKRCQIQYSLPKSRLIFCKQICSNSLFGSSKQNIKTSHPAFKICTKNPVIQISDVILCWSPTIHSHPHSIGGKKKGIPYPSSMVAFHVPIWMPSFKNTGVFNVKFEQRCPANHWYRDATHKSTKRKLKYIIIML